MSNRPQQSRETETGFGYKAILARKVRDSKYYSYQSDNTANADNSDDVSILQDINERHKDAWRKLADM